MRTQPLNPNHQGRQLHNQSHLNRTKPAPEVSYLWTLSGLALLAACGGGGGGGGGISAIGGIPTTPTNPGSGRLLVTGGGQNIPLVGYGVPEHNTNAVTAAPGGVSYGGSGRTVYGNAGGSVNNPVAGSNANSGKGTAIQGTYGTLYLEAFDASFNIFSYAEFTYELNNNHARLDTLDAGETITDVFFFSTGAGGPTARHTVTIGGINEPQSAPEFGSASADMADTSPTAPTLRHGTDPATDGTITIGEDSLHAADMGVLVVGDPDTPVTSLSIKAAVTSGSAEPATAGADSLDYVPLSGEVDGAYGVFTVGAPDPATGELRVAYILDSSGEGHDAVQALDDGESLFEKLTLSACDGAEESAPVILLVIIEGADEVPPTEDDYTQPADIV